LDHHACTLDCKLKQQFLMATTDSEEKASMLAVEMLT
jgi:hypothetical protein